MTTTNLIFRPLKVEDESSFKEAVEVFKQESPPFEFAFHFDPQEEFAAYVKKAHNWSQGVDLHGNFVPNSFYVAVVEGQVVGRLSLRHCLNDFLSRLGGHIGYAVVPTHRNRGYATQMLRQALTLCADFPIDPVLILCDEDNLASQKVIQRCGGIYEKTTNDPNLTTQRNRYWIDPKPYKNNPRVSS